MAIGLAIWGKKVRRLLTLIHYYTGFTVENVNMLGLEQ